MALFSEKDVEKEEPKQLEKPKKNAFRFNEKNVKESISEPKEIVKVVPDKKKEEKPKVEPKVKKQKKEKPKKDTSKKKNPKMLGFLSRKKKEALFSEDWDELRRLSQCRLRQAQPDILL